MSQAPLQSLPGFGCSRRAWAARVAAALLVIGGAWLATAAEAGAAALRVRPLTGTAYEQAALATENRVREQVDAPLRMDFHRRQAWRIKPAASSEVLLLSVAWWKEDGGDTHCVLGVAAAAPRAAGGLLTVDALEGETDPPPWSCEGEPAVRIVDLDGDGCPEVLAQYNLRPPSGEVFAWGLVLRCEPVPGGAAGAAPRLAFDAERSTRWREAQRAKRPPRSLREAEALLRTRRP